MRRYIILTLLLAFTLGMSAKTKYSYYYQRAEEYYEKEDYDQALHYLLQGVEANKKDGPCWAVIAEIYSKYAYARYAEALEASAEALRYLSKDRMWTSFILGIRGDIYYKIGDYEKSRVAYENSILINRNSDIVSSLADVYSELGLYDRAITTYKALLQDDMAQPYFHADLAQVYLKAGRYDEARQSCRMSLALLPEGNNRAYAYMGRIALADKHDIIDATYWAMEAAFKGSWSDPASDLIDTLVQLDFHTIETAALQQWESVPTDKNHMALLVYIYNEKGKPVESAYYTQRILQLGEDHSYHYGLASSYNRLGMYDEALSEYRQVLTADSSLYRIYYDMAAMAMRNNKLDEALTLMQKGVAESKDDPHYIRNLAKIYRNMEQHEKAIELLEKALALSEEDDRRVIYLNLGEENIWAGHAEEGHNYLDLCLEMEASKRPYKVTLSLAAATKGDTAKAMSYVRELEENTAPHEYEDLAMIYCLLGNKEKALENIRLDAQYTGSYLGKRLLHEYRYRLLWDDPDFQALAEEQEAYLTSERKRLAEMSKQEETVAAVTEIPFTVTGGVNQVRCTINGLPLYFVFDTGASDVTISSVEANFMLKNGYLTDADFLGKQNFVTATGEIHEGTIINLREVRVGDITLTNIQASVVSSQSAPLLLGQTVFRRFGTLEVDNQQHIITFKK